jgi:hypothetical protein
MKLIKKILKYGKNNDSEKTVCQTSGRTVAYRSAFFAGDGEKQ